MMTTRMVTAPGPAAHSLQINPESPCAWAALQMFTTPPPATGASPRALQGRWISVHREAGTDRLEMRWDLVRSA